MQRIFLPGGNRRRFLYAVWFYHRSIRGHRPVKVVKQSSGGSESLLNPVFRGSVTSRAVADEVLHVRFALQVLVVVHIFSKNMSYLRTCTQLSKLSHARVRYFAFCYRQIPCHSRGIQSISSHFKQRLLRSYPKILTDYFLSVLQQFVWQGLAASSILPRSLSTQTQTLVCIPMLKKVIGDVTFTYI